jgi:hypothetical protein
MPSFADTHESANSRLKKDPVSRLSPLLPSSEHLDILLRSVDLKDQIRAIGPFEGRSRRHSNRLDDQ